MPTSFRIGTARVAAVPGGGTDSGAAGCADAIDAHDNATTTAAAVVNSNGDVGS